MGNVKKRRIEGVGKEKEREMEGEIQRERPRVRGRWGDSRGERGASKSSYKGLPRAGQHQDRMDGPRDLSRGQKASSTAWC